MSTVSSKLHCVMGPLPLRLMPWRVMAIRQPLHVMMSTLTGEHEGASKQARSGRLHIRSA